MGRRRKKRLAIGNGNLALCLLFIFPLFLAYHVGVAFTHSQNGVDFITRVLLQAMDGNREMYLAFQGGLGIAYAFILWLIWREDSLPTRQWTPMALESVIYALTLGSLVVLLLDPIISLALVNSQISDVLRAGVTSLGAGVYEEIVFRLGIMGGVILLLRKMDTSEVVALGCGLILSSLLFALAHYLGTKAEVFALGTFCYRVVAGLAFGLICYYRSLAHAVYTHVFYDIYVFMLQA